MASRALHGARYLLASQSWVLHCENWRLRVENWHVSGTPGVVFLNGH